MPESTNPAAAYDDALCDELLAYLQEHPRAMDSLEGIAEWWLPRHHIRLGVERVARALEALTAQHLLERFDDGDHLWYRLRQTAPQQMGHP